MKSLILFLVSINLYTESDIRFISYGKIPTWSGIGISWNKEPKVLFYDSSVYKGHSEFVSKALSKNINFSEFKKLSKFKESREYFPFFVYDLSEKIYKKKKTEKINWALRIEDYNYTDSPLEISNEIKKLVQLILEKEPSFSDKPILILQKNDSSMSEKKISKFLKEFEILDLNDLIKHFAASKTLILNESTSEGRLVLVKNEKTLSELKPTDIPILNFIPDSIPNIAGIITLVPQSPLSHLNLLAKNRNIFNSYIEKLESIPNLKKLISKNVKIYSEKEKIFIKEIKTVNKKNIQKIFIPEMDLSLKEVIELNEDNEKNISVEKIGGKANNYFYLRKQIPIHTKNAYAVGFHFYKETIKGESENIIQSFLSSEKKFSVLEKKKSLEKIRESILKNSKIPNDLILDLKKKLSGYPKKTKFRLRSSSNAEDSILFNGAGIYSSKGFYLTDSVEKISEKILNVYSSLWSEKAFFEREIFQIEHKKVGMAILVHEAFNKEIANGVILVKDSELILNSQVGETKVVKDEKNIYSESIILDESCNLKSILTESNLSPVFLNVKQKESILKSICKTSFELKEDYFKNKIKNVEKKNFAVEIEFKLMAEANKQEFYFKQIRPILETKIENKVLKK